MTILKFAVCIVIILFWVGSSSSFGCKWPYCQSPARRYPELTGMKRGSHPRGSALRTNFPIGRREHHQQLQSYGPTTVASHGRFHGGRLQYATNNPIASQEPTGRSISLGISLALISIWYLPKVIQWARVNIQWKKIYKRVKSSYFSWIFG